MNCRTASGALFLMSIAGLAQDNPATSTSPLVFEDARVNVPPGWKHVETQAGASKGKALLIVPPDNTAKKNLAIVLLPGQDLRGADFQRTFDAVLKNGLASNEHLVRYSEMPVRKDAAGYDFLTRLMVVADDAGHNSVRVCFGANPRHRLEMLIVSADSQETLKQYQAEVGSVLRSYSFVDGPVSAGAKTEEVGPAHVPARADSGSPGAAGRYSGANPNAERGGAAGAEKAIAPGTRSRVPDSGSVLLCTDPARLDGAMMFAKVGSAYNALRALRHESFFRVNGPASLEVLKSELQSEWPKVFVKVLDGDLAGRTGWVVLSELKDLKQTAK